LELKEASLGVNEADLERELNLVRAAASCPGAGIFGPDSMMWRVDRELSVFLGAGRALLLQLAHPWVAAAIAEHSRGLADPIGRFHRTFNIVFTMVFGTLDQAMAAARRLHHRHAGISGTLPETAGRFAAGSPYRANDVAALRWVHATLIETALLTHDLVLPPLTQEDRERYYAEARLFGGAFGIPQASLPQHWTDFTAYTEAMRESDTLSVSAAARRIAEEIFGGAGTWLRVPAWYRALTARMLPDRFRESFGFAYGDTEQRTAERALACIRRVYPLLPGRLRFVGPYQEAQNRLSGGRRDVMIGLTNRFWIGQPRMTG
jgi:uncharacterized protein (DUF2236 family)